MNQTEQNVSLDARELCAAELELVNGGGEEAAFGAGLGAGIGLGASAKAK